MLEKWAFLIRNNTPWTWENEKIRLEKDLDILLDAKGVFSGGIDITDALITKLNSNMGR